MAQSVTSQGKSETVELTRALEHIESALSGVLTRIQQLNDESQQAKTEISQTFGRQLSHLHSRETQLLRQVRFTVKLALNIFFIDFCAGGCHFPFQR